MLKHGEFRLSFRAGDVLALVAAARVVTEHVVVIGAAGAGVGKALVDVLQERGFDVVTNDCH